MNEIILSEYEKKIIAEIGYVQKTLDNLYLKLLDDCYFLDFSPIGKILSFHVPKDFSDFDRVMELLVHFISNTPEKAFRTYAVRKRGGISIVGDKKPDYLYIFFGDEHKIDPRTTKQEIISIVFLRYTEIKTPLDDFQVHN